MKHARTIAIVIGLLLVIATAWGARVLEGNRAMLDSDAAVQRKDAVDAILTARVAASSRCPFCPASARGYARLEAIAKDAETNGDDVMAFSAFRAMRAAALASDAPDRRERADSELARLGQKIDAARTQGSAATAAANEGKLRDALAEDDVPRGATFALLAVGAIGFALGAIRFARSGRKLPELGLAVLGVAIAAAGIVYF